MAIKAELLEEYVTGAVLDALESPRVQEALRAEDYDAAHAGGAASQDPARRRISAPTPAATSPTG